MKLISKFKVKVNNKRTKVNNYKVLKILKSCLLMKKEYLSDLMVLNKK